VLINQKIKDIEEDDIKVKGKLAVKLISKLRIGGDLDEVKNEGTLGKR